MKTLPRVLTFLLLTSAAATSSLPASTRPTLVSPDPKMTMPAPVSTVEPTGVPRDFVDSTVEVVMTIDAQGRPRDLVAGRGVDAPLAKRLFPAIRQWRFSPATQDGRPVPLRVVLPLKLVCRD